MKIRVINKSKYPLPGNSTASSAGIDVRANIEKEIFLKPMERALIKSGVNLEIPEGYEAQIRLRSGNAMKKEISILKSPGTIDAD